VFFINNFNETKPDSFSLSSLISSFCENNNKTNSSLELIEEVKKEIISVWNKHYKFLDDVVYGEVSYSKVDLNNVKLSVPLKNDSSKTGSDDKKNKNKTKMKNKIKKHDDDNDDNDDDNYIKKKKSKSKKRKYDDGDDD
jgi:septum formation topological specificity factor MinE